MKMKNLANSINNSKVFTMNKNDAEYSKEYNDLYCKTFEYFLMLPPVNNHHTEEYGSEFDQSFNNCFENYDGVTAQFLTYFRKDILFRIANAQKKERAHLDMCVKTMSGDDGEETVEEAFDRNVASADLVWGMYYNETGVEVEMTVEKKVNDILFELENAFDSLQARTKPLISSFLTYKLCEAFDKKEFGLFKIETRSFFNVGAFKKYNENHCAFSLKALAEEYGVQVPNASRCIHNFIDKVNVNAEFLFDEKFVA